MVTLNPWGAMSCSTGSAPAVWAPSSLAARPRAQLAVKVVHAAVREDEEFRARFRQEVAAARRVSGAFTAPVVDADPDAERPWMATLYIPRPDPGRRV